MAVFLCQLKALRVSHNSQQWNNMKFWKKEISFYVYRFPEDSTQLTQCWFLDMKEVPMTSSSEWNILFPKEASQLSMGTCLLHYVLKRAGQVRQADFDAQSFLSSSSEHVW